MKRVTVTSPASAARATKAPAIRGSAGKPLRLSEISGVEDSGNTASAVAVGVAGESTMRIIGAEPSVGTIRTARGTFGAGRGCVRACATAGGAATDGEGAGVNVGVIVGVGVAVDVGGGNGVGRTVGL